jgi:hypothetical protein
MLSHRRRPRRSYAADDNNTAEAASPVATSQDPPKPEEVPLPPSRPPSIDDTADIINTASVGVASAEDLGSAREHEPLLGAEVDSQNETGVREHVVSAYIFRVSSHCRGYAEIPTQQRADNAPASKEPVDWPNPFADGAKKLTEFWPLYVKEADNFDRELSDGWNKCVAGPMLTALSSF